MNSPRAVRTLLGTTLLASAAACGGAYSAGPGAAGANDVGRSSAYMGRTLDRPALLQHPNERLYDAVMQRWPNLTDSPWARAAASLPSAALSREREEVAVYAAGTFLGGLDQIRDIPAAWVTRVQRLIPSEEQIRFGRSHPGGAIVLEWANPRR